MPGPAEVSWAKLALDYEAFVGRALLASCDHRLRGTRLPLGKAAGLVERYCAQPPWDSVAPSSPWGAVYALTYWPARSLRLATR